MDAHVAHLGCPLTKTVDFQLAAPKKFDQQDAANIERFIHHGIHLRIGFHLFPCQVAQAIAQQAGCQDEQGENRHADQGQPPFKRQHHGQYRHSLDDLGDDAHQWCC